MITIPFLSKKPEVVGIDIGSHRVKVVRMAPKKTGGMVAFCKSMEWNPLETGATESLKSFIQREGLKGCRAASCLSDPDVKMSKMELPGMPEGDLREAVRWKMRDILEGPMESYVVRSIVLEELAALPAKKLSLLGLANKRERVTALSLMLKQIGLEDSFIEPEAVTLAASVERVCPSREVWVGALDIGAKKNLLIINGQGKFSFARSLPANPLPGPRADDAQFNQKLAALIQNTIDTFTVSYKVEKLGRLFLCGGGASQNGLSEHLTTNLGIPTEILNPFQGLELAPGIEKGFMENQQMFAQATALAQVTL